MLGTRAGSVAVGLSRGGEPISLLTTAFQTILKHPCSPLSRADSGRTDIDLSQARVRKCHEGTL